ncbi:meiotic recombination protein SPO11, putative [Entamoeba dispar SAW760]|uniref:DNA topoisomerase (ATP-hydrolyzing) n=1 Tax=Entamoeba dispar (strain ATCC PRA-260 / SAW760) TaxID=370354 RepID=B0EG64_ENTDS|nr:meiotic recombination protein SPO11, putative [Entamoeba dispar SAW760]EDR26491.1 meiotic recombination protein SPO11, putative [Entamoeba dispar SAW760]|eukprot:EDR26491.1 meiotic recombination protein SPO11, putative [Entamoeba dispar SAW760]
MANSNDVICIIEEITQVVVKSLVQKHKFPLLQTKRNCNVRCPRFTVKKKKYFKLLVILSTIYELILTNKQFTVRELYYTHKTIFKDQTELENLIRDIKLLFGVNDLNILHLTHTPRGILFGEVTLVTPIYVMDFTKKLQLPILSSPFQFIIPNRRCFLLIVEKEAFFERLVQSHLSDQFPCIILCSRGFPDNATFTIAHHLTQKLNIIPCCLVDGDVYGIEIFLTFLCGSWKKNGISRISKQNDEGISLLRWSLLRPSDTKGISPLTDREKVIANHMLESEVVKCNQEIELEIKTLLKNNTKMELDELANTNVSFFETTIISSCLHHSTLFKIPIDGKKN